MSDSDVPRRIYSSIEELRVERRKAVDGLLAIGFEDGLRRLLADLYPDNAHFIYELLQNAEDAQARTVQFKLEPDRLIVTHDGRRRFTIADVEGISGIGLSTKRVDAKVDDTVGGAADGKTQIGKFGVGFKAVYAYTSLPKVSCREYSFVITDLFVPEEADGRRDDDLTVFELPFDGSRKDPEVAFSEVARSLRELGSTSLLFLSNISTLYYEICDGRWGSVSRLEGEYPRILIEEMSDASNDTVTTEWIRLVGTADKLDRPLQVSAAFKLAPPTGDIKRSPTRRSIEPIQSGDTCIYFPAVKETSGLRFHIHAPFASTVARDSVRQTEENAVLVVAIADLIADSLGELKDAGFIDDGLLAALPNDQDDLGPGYEVIRERTLESFRATPLTPVFGGGAFARASDLISSPQEFRSCLQPARLPELLRMAGLPHDNAQWIAPRDGRPGQFLKSLRCREFGWDELAEMIVDLEDAFFCLEPDEESSPATEFWLEWLASLSDVELLNLYELIGYAYLEDHLSGTLELPIIRVLEGGEAVHLPGEGIYIAKDDSNVVGKCVPSHLLPERHGRDRQRPKDAVRACYLAAGVREWNEQAVVKSRLLAYENGTPSWDEHLADVRLFVDFLRRHPSDAALFTRHRLLWAEDDGGNEVPVSASSIFLDQPYNESGLSALLFAEQKYRLSGRYDGEVQGIESFAVVLGATQDISIKQTTPWMSNSAATKNPKFNPSWRWEGKETKNMRHLDWTIPLFRKIVASNDERLLRTLWNTVCRSEIRYSQGLYQANSERPAHYFPSRLIQDLRETAWILDRAGRLRTPQSMTAEELRDGWPPPREHSLSAAIEFGKNAQQEQLAEEKRKQSAQLLGLTEEFAEEVRDASPEEQRAMLEFLRRERAQGEFPVSQAVDAGRRGSAAAEDAKNAPVYEKEVKERQVATAERARVAKEARAFLRGRYTEDGVTWCQSCQQPMPFKVGERSFFFAVEVVRDRRYLHRTNFLALCPLCAAMYRHAREPDDAELIKRIAEAEIEPDGKMEVEVELAGQPYKLRFDSGHAVDLKAFLAVAGDERESE